MSKIPDHISEIIIKESETERPYCEKREGKEAYNSVMLYEVNDERQEGFIRGATFIYPLAYAQGIRDVIELMKENDYPEETKYAEHLEKLFAAINGAEKEGGV